MLISKNALCWLCIQKHSRTGLGLCLKMLCAIFVLTITVQQLCAVAAQSCLGILFVLWHRRRRKDCPWFRTPHLHTAGHVNDLFCRVLICVVGSQLACVYLLVPMTRLYVLCCPRYSMMAVCLNCFLNSLRCLFWDSQAVTQPVQHRQVGA